MTVIAAGFDGGSPARRPVESAAVPTSSRSAIGSGRAGEIGQSNGSAGYRDREPAHAEQVPVSMQGGRNGQGSANGRTPVEEPEDDVDVPSFMRR